MSNGTPSYSLTSSSALSDDYILTADVLVDVTSTSPVGVFQNANGISEALFVRSDQVLCQLVYAPGTSAAGWAATPVGTTSGVTQAAAGVHSDGSIHGFYTDASNLYHITFDGSAWSAPQTLRLCSSLTVANNFVTGELIAYGVDDNGALQLVRDISGNWTANAITFPSSLTGLEPVLLFTDAVDDWMMAVSGGAVAAGQLQLYTGSATAMASGPMNVATPNPVQQILTGYWMNNSALFVFTDNKNNLYTNVGTVANVVQIPNTTVMQGAAVVDLDNDLHLYTVDTDGTISVLHQTGWNSTTGPQWAPRIPLATEFKLLFTDANPMDSTSFFAVDVDGALWSYAFDATAQTWTSAKAQMPSITTFQVPTYRTLITVVDENGNPAPNLPVTVTADSLSAVVVQGTFLPVGPAQPATVTTNALGSVTLTTVATATSSPQLTFTAANLAAPGPVNPAANVHTYLSGQGTLNDGTSSALPAFSPTTLQQAQVAGKPLAPGAASNTAMANAAAAGISTMFQVNAGSGRTAAAANSGITGFILDFTNPNDPTYTPLTSEEEFQHARALAIAGDSLGSWWDDVKDFFADVWHGVRNAAVSVMKWVVHTIDATVDMVVKIGEEIHTIAGLIIKGIEDVVSVVQSIFAAVGAEMDKLLDWLKMLFDWQDIVDTKNALESALSQAFPWLANVIENQGSKLLDGFFSKLENQVSSAFDTVIAQVQGQSLGQLAGSTSPLSARFRYGAMTPVLAHTIAQAPLSGLSTVQNNWLLEKIESYFAGGPALQPVSGLVTPLETLKSAFETVATDFVNALTAFADFFKTALTDPKELATLGVADLLTAARDVALAVLAFLDGIITALLQVLGEAVNAAGAILNAPFTLPIISGIVDQLASLLGFTIPAASVTTIFCFGLAIPITIFYKLINGVDTEPFPGGILPTGAQFRAAFAGNAATGVQFAAVGVAAIWALMDTGLDCVPDVDMMFFKVIDVIAPALLNVLTWPGGIPFTPIPLSSPEDIASFANWIAAWLVVGLDIALLVAGAISWAPQTTIARYIDPTGKILMSAFGGINLVAGIVASSLGASGGAIAGNILGPLPGLTQFLRIDSIVEGSGGITFAIKLVVDFFAGEGYAVAIAAS
jgi:hypothetical protein